MHDVLRWLAGHRTLRIPCHAQVFCRKQLLSIALHNKNRDKKIEFDPDFMYVNAVLFMGDFSAGYAVLTVSPAIVLNNAQEK